MSIYRRLPCRVLFSKLTVSFAGADLRVRLEEGELGDHFGDELLVRKLLTRLHNAHLAKYPISGVVKKCLKQWLRLISIEKRMPQSLCYFHF